MEIVLVTLGIGLTIGVIIAVLPAPQKKRMQELQAIAQHLRFSFFPQGNDSIQPFLANLDFFSIGKSRQIRNLMTGQIQQQGITLHVSIFDYEYTLGFGNRAETCEQTIVLFYSPSLHLPTFSLRPGNSLGKLANRREFEIVDFPKSPNFSASYSLISTDELAIRQLFQVNLLRFFETQPLWAEASATYVAIISAGDRPPLPNFHQTRSAPNSPLLPPEAVKPFLDIGLRLMALLSKNAVHPW